MRVSQPKGKKRHTCKLFLQGLLSPEAEGNKMGNHDGNPPAHSTSASAAICACSGSPFRPPPRPPNHPPANPPTHPTAQHPPIHPSSLHPSVCRSIPLSIHPAVTEACRACSTVKALGERQADTVPVLTSLWLALHNRLPTTKLANNSQSSFGECHKATFQMPRCQG